MPFVTAEDGVRIHYELDGPESGIPLVLLHGFTMNLRHWYECGYVERLQDRFRLLLIDARGHGSSDKPVLPDAYDDRTQVLDLVAVMLDAGVDRAHLWGYSMGGRITQNAAIYAPPRFRSLTIGGFSPYGAKDSAISGVPWEELWEVRKTMPGADREAWGAAHKYGRASRGAVQALRTTRVPHLLYAGTADPNHRGQAEFVGKYGSRHFEISGMEHWPAFRDSATEVVPQVTAFIDEVEAASK